MKGALNNLKNVLNASKNLKKTQPEFSDTGMLSWRATVVRKKMIEFSQRSRDEEISQTKHIAEPFYPLSKTQTKFCTDYQEKIANNPPTPESNRKSIRNTSSERIPPQPQHHRPSPSPQRSYSPRQQFPRKSDQSHSGSTERKSNRESSWETQESSFDSGNSKQQENGSENKWTTTDDTQRPGDEKKNTKKDSWKPENSPNTASSKEIERSSGGTQKKENPMDNKADTNKRGTLDDRGSQSKEQPPTKKFKNESGESIPASNPVRAPQQTPSEPTPIFNEIVAPVQPEEKRRSWKRSSTGGDSGRGKKPMRGKKR